MYKIYRQTLIEISEFLDEFSKQVKNNGDKEKLQKVNNINNWIKKLVFAHENKPNS